MTKVKKHSPTLETIRMIENKIKSNNGKYTKTQLWKKLPKQTMYQTYKVALDYLLDSNKIVMNSHKVTWIYYPKLFKKLMSQTVETELDTV